MERVDLNAFCSHPIGASEWALDVTLMKDFPRRLHHDTPGWVREGSPFHIRIRIAKQQRLPLIEPVIARGILRAVQRYHELNNWWCDLFLIMPDHIHMMLVFPLHADLAVTIRNWKRGTARFQNVQWQDNFFDHRIRSDKEGRETWHYIQGNPVAKGLCNTEAEWPWWWSGSLQPVERVDRNALD